MKVKIVGGKLKGSNLVCPTSRLVRPTSGKVREAIFDILGPEVEGRRVADLFCGSGALGIEAISRGADSCDFAESSHKYISALRANLDSLGIPDQCRVFHGRIPGILNRMREGGAYELVLADPPYAKGQVERLLVKIQELNLLEPEGILVIEYDHRRESLRSCSGFRILRRKQYGDTGVVFLSPAG